MVVTHGSRAKFFTFARKLVALLFSVNLGNTCLRKREEKRNRMTLEARLRSCLDFRDVEVFVHRRYVALP